ncbi:hypothetical protein GGR53DRAFT_481317 [Hypoxylon sp. FL1150]|nr:hypothetical protein GGR53DRAFT_481317 [Hypoxylon sp. FL1150]
MVNSSSTLVILIVFKACLFACLYSCLRYPVFLRELWVSNTLSGARQEAFAGQSLRHCLAPGRQGIPIPIETQLSNYNNNVHVIDVVIKRIRG